MPLEQVNVQELQRLGDAINMTMEAIRRVAPQIALLQQQANPFGGFGGQQWGQPQMPWQPQYGQQLYPQTQQVGQLDPITAAYIQGHIQGVRSVLSQLGQQQQGGFGQQQPGFGQQQPGFGQQQPGYGQQMGFGQQPFGTPFVGGQRPF